MLLLIKKNLENDVMSLSREAYRGLSPEKKKGRLIEGIRKLFVRVI